VGENLTLVKTGEFLERSGTVVPYRVYSEITAR
jgi:hypothetical protein